MAIVPWLGFARRKSLLSRYALGRLWAMETGASALTIPLGNAAVPRRWPRQCPRPIGHREAASRRSRGSPLEIDGDVLPLGVAVEHPLERVLAADAALLVAAVGLTRKLTEPLVDLDPA